MNNHLALRQRQKIVKHWYLTNKSYKMKVSEFIILTVLAFPIISCKSTKNITQPEQTPTMEATDLSIKTVVSESNDTSEDGFYVIVEDPPLFDGKSIWEEGFREYTNKKFIFPRELAESAPTGRIYVEFIIEKDGSVSNVKVIRGVDPLLDAEALRVINSSSSKWTPGKVRGKTVRVKLFYAVPFMKISD